MQTPGGKEQGVQEENHCQTQTNPAAACSEAGGHIRSWSTLCANWDIVNQGASNIDGTGWAKMKEPEKVRES